VVIVSAASVYHCAVLPVAHELVNIAEDPLHILGAFMPVGIAGIGVTVTTVLVPGPLHVGFIVFKQAA
jgi:hypothetical protein